MSGSKSVRKRDGKLGENGDGFWLRFKRLEKGHFRWPQPGSEATITLSAEELGILLGGAKVELKLRRNEVLERRAI